MLWWHRSRSALTFRALWHHFWQARSAISTTKWLQYKQLWLWLLLFSSQTATRNSLQLQKLPKVPRPRTASRIDEARLQIHVFLITTITQKLTRGILTKNIIHKFIFIRIISFPGCLPDHTFPKRYDENVFQRSFLLNFVWTNRCPLWADHPECPSTYSKPDAKYHCWPKHAWNCWLITKCHGIKETADFQRNYANDIIPSRLFEGSTPHNPHCPNPHPSAPPIVENHGPGNQFVLFLFCMLERVSHVLFLESPTHLFMMTEHLAIK